MQLAVFRMGMRSSAALEYATQAAFPPSLPPLPQATLSASGGPLRACERPALRLAARARRRDCPPLSTPLLL